MEEAGKIGLTGGDFIQPDPDGSDLSLGYAAGPLLCALDIRQDMLHIVEKGLPRRR